MSRSPNSVAEEENSDTEYCARISAALESKISFGSEQEDEGAGQRGGATTYRFDEDSDSDRLDSDEYTFSSVAEPPSPAYLHEATPTVFNGAGADMDSDGWDSAAENCLSLTTSSNGEIIIHITRIGNNKLEGEFFIFPLSLVIPDVYRRSGYGEWEDEVQSLFSSCWESEPEKVHALLREMFEVHEDTHALVCFFLRRMGRRKPNKRTLQKILLEDFQKWKEEQKMDLQK